MGVPNQDVPALRERGVIEYKDRWDKILLEPVLKNIHTDTASTNIWEQLARAFNYWINVTDTMFKEINQNYRMFHYSDIILFKNLRKNPTVVIPDNEAFSNSICGLPLTLNAVLHINLLAAQDLTRLHPSKAPRQYLEQIADSCLARCMRQEWNESLNCPTEAEYYHMIVKQNSGHFGAQIRSLQLHSSNQTDFKKLIAILGLFLHILEDYQYFVSVDETENTINLTDAILERFSLPIIHAIKSETAEGDKIADMLRRRSKKKELKTYATSLLEKTGSLMYTRNTLIKLRNDALLEITKFGENPPLESIFLQNFNIPSPPDTVKTNELENSIKYVNETLTISSYLNKMENVAYEEKIKQILLKPYNHLFSLSERKLVLKMFGLFNNTFKIPEEKFGDLKDLYNTIVYGLLILDDLQDNSILRKRKPCAHLIYGMMNTINCGIYCFLSIGMQHILNFHNVEGPNVYFAHMLQLLRGQGMELYWRETFYCPTEDEYAQMVNGKTGSVMRLILTLMEMCSELTMNIEKIPTAVSLYIQVYDDFENLIGQEYYDVKGFCEDLTEGKFGFPTIHAISTHPEEGQKIMDILRKRTYDIEVKKRCLNLLKSCGSFEYTRNKLTELRRNMFITLAQFHNHNEIGNLLKEMFPVTSEDP